LTASWGFFQYAGVMVWSMLVNK